VGHDHGAGGNGRNVAAEADLSRPDLSGKRNRCRNSSNRNEITRATAAATMKLEAAARSVRCRWMLSRRIPVETYLNEGAKNDCNVEPASSKISVVYSLRHVLLSSLQTGSQGRLHAPSQL